MSNNAHYPTIDEFTLMHPTLKVFATRVTSDEASEKLIKEIKPIIENHLAVIKASVENHCPEVRVGFELT